MALIRLYFEGALVAFGARLQHEPTSPSTPPRRARVISDSIDYRDALIDDFSVSEARLLEQIVALTLSFLSYRR
jgi:hypothetical protein